MKKPLVILTGPTAVGKTELSLELAERISGEIVSADSMQVYRRMNIGTAKITPDQMRGIPHHLIDILEPEESFNVTMFVDLAKQAIDRICEKGKIPIVTGGTGFYIQALLYDVEFGHHEESETYRKKLTQIASEKGPDYLHGMLCEVDREYALSVHANNVKRVIRALEYYQETGKKLSEHNQSMRERSPRYDASYYVLYHDREHMYERINQRVDIMIDEGLESEVSDLIREGCTEDMQSMQGIGYKEFFPYFAGKCSLEETVEAIKKDTRHFAKRQMTWFRREKDVIWISKENQSDQEILSGILHDLRI